MDKKTCVEGRIIIGNYVLEEVDNDKGVWIYSLDGEDGIFNSEDLEKIIDQFYQENF